MKLAVVTSHPSPRSGIGDYTARLLPHLAERVDVRVFVEPGREGAPIAGLPTESIEALVSREHDQILYQLGNETGHAFMVEPIRELGGAVCLHDWILFDLAVAARPALASGGLRGLRAAWVEGGSRALRTYVGHLRARKHGRAHPAQPPPDGRELDGPFVFGWHAPQEDGRWTSDLAQLRCPGRETRELHVEVAAGSPRAFAVRRGGEVLAELGPGGGAVRVELGGEDRPLVELSTAGVAVDARQRAAGDTRRLGSFVRALRVVDESGEHALDLCLACALPPESFGLDRERFRLPLNRSVVRFGDAFVVHSEHVGKRIVEDRNAPTPVAVVPHGAEPCWRDVDRAAERERLGLGPDWRDAFVATSFGAVQRHKRIEPLLRGLAAARAAGRDARLVLVGRLEADVYDPGPSIRSLGLDRFVHMTDYADEERAREWIRAGDLAVQLRGPSTGGTSGGLYQSLSVGRGALVSEEPEQAELPDECVVRVAADGSEVESLARHLAELAGDPGRRSSLEAGARGYVERECAWPRVADRYVEAFGRFPRPHSARRSFVWTAFHEAFREGRADARREAAARGS